MTNTLESIARGEIDAVTARSEIDRHIEVTRDFAKLYSVLLRWTWLALSERRTDDDLRQWHRLILDVSARAGQGKCLSASAQSGLGGTSAHLTERLRALSDMIRVSIGMQMRPDKARLLTRAHVPAILQALYDRQNEAVARFDLLQAVELKTANLSRILALLVLEGLVERQADGRTARFRITGEGIRHLLDHNGRNEASVRTNRSTSSVSVPQKQFLTRKRGETLEPVKMVRVDPGNVTRSAKKQGLLFYCANYLPENTKTDSVRGARIVSGAEVKSPAVGHGRGSRAAPETFDVVDLSGDASSMAVLYRLREQHFHLPGSLPPGSEVHGEKNVAHEYTAFEALLPTSSPEKSAGG
ncbi:helix-turn-helix domain-containing protein [Rhodobacteraceae bacterium G21628-S1]|nr:helix-turn-helix domain-containing protein [Rhodobacteraceae bacterium G21628-S1]